MSKVNLDRLETANKVLKTLGGHSEFKIENGKLYFEFGVHKSTLKVKRFSSDANLVLGFKTPFSSTQNALIVSLGNWMRNKPCYPLTTIRHWVCLGLWESESASSEAISLLENSDYPRLFGVGCFRPRSTPAVVSSVKDTLI